MKASKIFIVIAYDISDDKRRYRIVKTLKQYGVAINMSVYECMLTKSQLEKLMLRLERIIDLQTDKIVYYPLCIDCFSKITYQPDKVKRKIEISKIV